MAGNVVLKLDAAPCHDWLGTTLPQVEPHGIRIATPVPTRWGTWRHDGWVATAWMEGVEEDDAREPRWRDVMEAGRAFHRAVADLARPLCLEQRQDPWAAADRAAWHEHPLKLNAAFTAVALRLREALEPPGRCQLVHGDLTGNVLFAPTYPPAVIDLSLYWRPTDYAEGVVLADALCWHDASPSLLPEVGVPVAAVARGMLFRMLTTSERVNRSSRPGPDLLDEARRYEAAASALGL